MADVAAQIFSLNKRSDTQYILSASLKTTDERGNLNPSFFCLFKNFCKHLLSSLFYGWFKTLKDGQKKKHLIYDDWRLFARIFKNIEKCLAISVICWQGVLAKARNEFAYPSVRYF
ncbi:MAG: hypothetical protein IJV86_00035 [Clostridia bacterium]|nr:hypothetical protein [Clostridia bacterium]